MGLVFCEQPQPQQHQTGWLGRLRTRRIARRPTMPKRLSITFDLKNVQTDLFFWSRSVYSWWLSCLSPGICLSEIVRNRSKSSEIVRKQPLFWTFGSFGSGCSGCANCPGLAAKHCTPHVATHRTIHTRFTCCRLCRQYRKSIHVFHIDAHVIPSQLKRKALTDNKSWMIEGYPYSISELMPSPRIMASCVAPPFGWVSDKITHVNESLLSLTQSCTGRLSEWLYCWILLDDKTAEFQPCNNWHLLYQVALAADSPVGKCGAGRSGTPAECNENNAMQWSWEDIECFQGGSISTKKAMRRKWIIDSLICKLTSLMGLIIWSDLSFLMYHC